MYRIIACTVGVGVTSRPFSHKAANFRKIWRKIVLEVFTRVFIAKIFFPNGRPSCCLYVVFQLPVFIAKIFFPNGRPQLLPLCRLSAPGIAPSNNRSRSYNRSRCYHCRGPPCQRLKTRKSYYTRRAPYISA